MRGEASDRAGDTLSWVVRLRWGAVLGQAVTIVAVDRLLRVPLPRLALALAVLVAAASNAIVWLAVVRPRRVLGDDGEHRLLAALMAFDVVVLTVLLYLSGGPLNPFSFLYLVYIALAAMLLRSGYTWALAGLSLLGSAALFAPGHHALDLSEAPLDHMTVHLRGMWVAFGVAAGFIVYFLIRLRGALQQRETDLAAARRLASLATLAAGAAHELSTPLSTIAVAAKELELALAGGAAAPAALLDDVRLIRAEVGRCRAVLERMAVDAGQSRGEGVEELLVGELAARATSGFAGLRLDVADATRARRVRLPPQAVGQALSGVIQNAIDASAAGAVVRVGFTVDGARLDVEVADDGGGMDAALLARVGEPFFTTKPPGRGMGLGLFLTRTVVDRLNGALDIRSTPGRGTVVRLSFPVQP